MFTASAEFAEHDLGTTISAIGEDERMDDDRTQCGGYGVGGADRSHGG